MPNRRSLLSAVVAVIVSAVALPSAVAARTHVHPDGRASLRQGDPTAGDADGDGVPDGSDGCPTQVGAGADGCYSFGYSVAANLLSGVIFEDGIGFNIRCQQQIGPTTSSCDVVASGTLQLSRASARKLGVTSTLIGRVAITQCGPGQACGRVKPSAAFKRAVHDVYRKSRLTGITGTYTVEMTSPKVETFRGTVDMSLRTDPGLRFCSKNYPNREHDAQCGGKGTGPAVERVD